MRQAGLSRDDYERFILCAEGRWGPSFGPGDPCTQLDYAMLARAYWETGAHTSVLCRSPSDQSVVGPWVEEPGPFLRWLRPKTRLLCRMPVTSEVGEWLEDDWLPRENKPHPATVSRNFREIGRLAGLGDVTAKTFRYSRGFILFKEDGPRAAQNSLGVSDKMLKHYVRVSDLDEAESLRGLL